MIRVSAQKKDEVYSKICLYDTVETILAKKLKYHSACYKKYIYVKSESAQRKAQNLRLIMK